MMSDGLDIVRGRGQVGLRQAARISIGRRMASKESLFMSLAWGLGVAAINMFTAPPGGRVFGASFSILFAFAIGYLSPIPWRVRLLPAQQTPSLRILLANGLFSITFGYVAAFAMLLVSGLIAWNVNALNFISIQLYAKIALWGFIFAPVGIGVIMGEDGERQKMRDARRAKRLTRLAEDARIVALRAQINPHFFFNALNTIAALIPERPADAERAVLLLADALRPVLTRDQPLTAPLAQELAIAGAYIQIEQLRLGGRLEFAVKVSPEFMGMELPSLSVQPLVENAVRYGAAKCDGAFRIVVDARRVGPMFVVEVRSAAADAVMKEFDAMTPAAKTPGHALHNIETRLVAHFGPTARLDVRADGLSAVALIVMPA
ncbi:hypothetical protein BH09SUM1_BH09SUM1_18120 [soil metagenome]